MGRDAVVGLLEGYAARDRRAGVRGDPGASGSAPRRRTFHVATDRGRWSARAVVIATGACGRPAVPAWARRSTRARAGHARPTTARRADLPDGGVLVVGASASGMQLAREIQASGRPVTLAVGRHTRLPRRYRGRDIMHWLDRAGILDEPWDRCPIPPQRAGSPRCSSPASRTRRT